MPKLSRAQPKPENDIELTLSRLIKLFGRAALAEKLGVKRTTVKRWENAPHRLARFRQLAFTELLKSSGGRQQSGFTFIDLFAGIGGMRLGFEAAGARCVFTSEWNEWSQRTYSANFGPEDVINGDITQIDASLIPEHDVLVAGFPCQPFSIAGVSKKNALGRPHGFACATQGTLFFDVSRIIAEKRPKAFLLENVKNLLSHDRGNTFRIICEVLRQELGYNISYRVIDSRHFVPQHRERILICGFREDTGFSFDSFSAPEAKPTLADILHPEDGSEAAEEPFTIGPLGTVNPKYTLSNKLWDYLQAYAAKHREAGNGFGFGLVSRDDTARTLSARYYKDGSEILVNQGKNKNPRRLTPRECARLMGFPSDFKIAQVSDTQAYKQFGNSVVVPVIKEVAMMMKPHLLMTSNLDANSDVCIASAV